jgi:DNA-binding response OmpR family regulator
MTERPARRVLVVDDSRFICEALGIGLRKAGFEVRLARDLWELERSVDRPDLVLMDVVLREAFGDEVALLLRGRRGVKCPILLMSSLPDSELAQRAADAGVDGYVSKRNGLAAIVARVGTVLGETGGSAPTDEDLVESFAVDARQRVRSVVYIAARPDRWNAAAIVGELHALAGDADIAGAHHVADAARACRDEVRQHGTAGWTAGMAQALGELAKNIGGTVATARKVLIIDDTDFCRDRLLRAFDHAGHVVVEAQTMAEARQKLRAADYDVIVLHAEPEAAAAMIRELKAGTRTAKIAVVSDGAERVEHADAVIAKRLDVRELITQIERLLSS